MKAVVTNTPKLTVLDPGDQPAHQPNSDGLSIRRVALGLERKLEADRVPFRAEAVLADRVTAPITTRQASTLADERHPLAPTSLRGQLGVAADEQHGLRAALTYVVEQSA